MQARGFLTFVDQGYTGNALADLLLGLPVLTGGARLDNPQNLRARTWSAFAHDDWRARPSLTISAGLRYDYIVAAGRHGRPREPLRRRRPGSSCPVGTGGMPRGGYEPDRNNLAPRAGFAWTLDQAARTVLRGGYGIYYNQGALATSEGLYFNPPYFNLGVYFPDPRLPLLTLADPFPASFPVFIPQSATAYQRDLQTPWMEHWNVNVQRQFGASRAIEVAYVGSRGHDLISARDLNQPAASPHPANLRPNPLFADITLIESRASSKYNALQIKYQQRASARAVAARSPTRSASRPTMRPASSRAPAIRTFRRTAWTRAPSRADRASTCVTASRQLRLRAAARQRASGCATSRCRAWSRSRAAGRSPSRCGPTSTTATPADRTSGSATTIGRTSPATPALDSPTAERWFDTAAFSLPAFGSFGNAGRNILTGPGYKNVNLAVIKYVPARDGASGCSCAPRRSTC